MGVSISNISANNGSEKLWEREKNSATTSKLIIAVYASYVCVYISCPYQSHRLDYNFLFVGLGGWDVGDNERNISA